MYRIPQVLVATVALAALKLGALGIMHGRFFGLSVKLFSSWLASYILRMSITIFELSRVPIEHTIEQLYLKPPGSRQPQLATPTDVTILCACYKLWLVSPWFTMCRPGECSPFTAMWGSGPCSITEPLTFNLRRGRYPHRYTLVES
jgi:hypothetical protein